MYQFIEVLRALSAIIITNAHYENVYPISIIANGGLLGDVLFFAISGFCLYEIKMTFFRWYGKRIVRIYPAVWIITLIYLGIGFYSVNAVNDVIRLLIYPTYYHFVASIMVIYIVYYFLISLSKRMKWNKSKSIIILFMVVLLVHCLIYLTVYDKSYYHIDSVYEPMIRFLFLEAMLIGGWMRENSTKLTERFQALYGGISLIVAILYFASKLLLVKFSVLAPFQIFNQILLLVLLIFIFVVASGIEKNIRKIPKRMYKIIKYISSITLEIYLVQYALIPRLNIGVFPLNFIIVTASILIVASGLHYITKLLISKLVKCIE